MKDIDSILKDIQADIRVLDPEVDVRRYNQRTKRRNSRRRYQALWRKRLSKTKKEEILRKQRARYSPVIQSNNDLIPIDYDEL